MKNQKFSSLTAPQPDCLVLLPSNNDWQTKKATLRDNHETALANVTTGAKARETALKQAQATLKLEHQVALSAAATQACNRETELKKEHEETLAKKAPAHMFGLGVC